MSCPRVVVVVFGARVMTPAAARMPEIGQSWRSFGACRVFSTRSPRRSGFAAPADAFAGPSAFEGSSAHQALPDLGPDGSQPFRRFQCLAHGRDVFDACEPVELGALLRFFISRRKADALARHGRAPASITGLLNTIL